jgi:hypothetical protein
MPRVIRPTAVGVVALACGLWAGTALAARSAVIATGTAGGVAPWKLIVSTRMFGSRRLPMVCTSLLWGDGPGQQPANGFPLCVAPDQGYFVGHKVRYRISLNIHGLHGVLPVSEEGGTPNFRGIAALVGATATRAVVTFDDGSQVQTIDRPLPRSLHLPFRIAWSAMVGNWTTASIKVRRIVAYNRRGKVVGHVEGSGPRL